MVVQITWRFLVTFFDSATINCDLPDVLVTCLIKLLSPSSLADGAVSIFIRDVSFAFFLTPSQFHIDKSSEMMDNLCTLLTFPACVSLRSVVPGARERAPLAKTRCAIPTARETNVLLC